jgi:hypothetical protein
VIATLYSCWPLWIISAPKRVFWSDSSKLGPNSLSALLILPEAVFKALVDTFASSWLASAWRAAAAIALEARFSLSDSWAFLACFSLKSQITFATKFLSLFILSS